MPSARRSSRGASGCAIAASRPRASGSSSSPAAPAGRWTRSRASSGTRFGSTPEGDFVPLPAVVARLVGALLPASPLEHRLRRQSRRSNVVDLTVTYQVEEGGGDSRRQRAIEAPWTAPAEVVTGVHGDEGGAGGDQGAEGGELVGGGEGVGRAVDEEGGDAQARQVRDAHVLGLAGRV